MRRLPSILALLTAAALGAACSDAAAPDGPADVPEQSAVTPTDTGSPRVAFPGAVWGYGAAGGADSTNGLGRVGGATVRALTGSPEREVARVVAGPDGTFAFEPLPDGVYRFLATPPAGSSYGPGELYNIEVRGGSLGSVQALNIILTGG